MENSNDSIKIIGALLVGAVVGGTLGILFAPDKGNETSKRIRGQADDLTKLLKDTFDNLLKEVTEEVANVRKKASEFSMDGKGK
jgi:gas vesicle protein